MIRLIRVIASLTVFTVLGIQATGAAQANTDPINFFSAFTVVSGIATGVTLACLALRPDLARSPRFTVVRGGVSVSMCGVGLLFTALLSTAPDEAVKHLVGSVAMVADWALDPPPRIRFRWTTAWLALPFVYLVYTLTRGHFTGWYPYHFLAPTPDRGYWGVLALAVGIGAVLAVVAFLLNQRAVAPVGVDARRLYVIASREDDHPTSSAHVSVDDIGDPLPEESLVRSG